MNIKIRTNPVLQCTDIVVLKSLKLNIRHIEFTMQENFVSLKPFMFKENKLSSIYRVHGTFSMSKINAIRETLYKHAGINYACQRKMLANAGKLKRLVKLGISYSKIDKTKLKLKKTEFVGDIKPVTMPGSISGFSGNLITGEHLTYYS